MSTLGDLFYTLKLDDSQFSKGIEDAIKKVAKLGDSSKVKIDDTDLKAALLQVDKLKKQFDNIGGKINVTITGIPKTENIGVTASLLNAEEIRSKITDALSNIELSNIQVHADEIRSSFRKEMFKVAIDIDADPNQLKAIITSLQAFLKTQKLTISVDGNWSKGAIDRLESQIKKQIKALNITGIKLEIDRNAIQNTLSSKPFVAQLDLKVNRNDVQNAIQSAVNQGGNIASGNSALQQRDRIQQKVNKGATDELGIRRSINDQMKTNTMLATMLGNTIGNVFGTYALQRFLEALISIGGEIQKQRMALGKILGNDSEANALFGQMKELAVKSPYGLLDLMKNARQLSAFGVQYNELYDTMRRLSDMAAGLGIEFGRLSLAFGETMERGFLDGKLVRQFSYMGLPVLQKIAEYYTEINKAGDGSIFSASDVRKMVSGREVSFEDLSAVIKKMTDEGGQFYNMQEVMADSVAGKWKNLKDAYDIMLSDMVEGNSQLLKAPAEFLTMLTRNYDKFVGVLEAVAVTMIGAKAASLLLTNAMGKQTVAAYQELMAEQKLKASDAQRMAMLHGKSVAIIKALGSTRLLKAAQLEQLVTENKLTAEEAKLIAMKQGVTAANSKALLSFRLITAAERNALVTGNMFQASWAKATIQLRFFTMQAKLAIAEMWKMAAAMATNPMTWVFAAASAFMSIRNSMISCAEKAEDMRNSLKNAMNDIADDAREISKRITLNTDSNGNITSTFAEEKTAIDELVKFIKDKMPGAQTALDRVFQLDSDGNYRYTLDEQYKMLKNYYDSVNNIANDSDNNKAISDVITDVLTPKWYHEYFHDDLMRDAKDFEKKYKEAFKSWTLMLQNLSNEQRATLDQEMRGYGVNTPSKLFDVYAKQVFEKGLVLNADNGLGYAINTVFHGYLSQYNEFADELVSAKDKIYEKLKALNIDPTKFENKHTIEILVRSYLDNSDASDFVKNKMVEEFKTRWGIDISMGGDYEQAVDLLKKWYGTYAGEDMSDSHSNIRKQYKVVRDRLKDLQDNNLKNYSKGLDASYPSTFDAKTKIGSSIKEAENDIKALKDLQKKVADEGIDLEAEWLKSQTKGGTRSKEDALLKLWKRQFDEIKKAYTEFTRWSEKVGKENAGKKVNQFGLIKEDTMTAFGLSTQDLSNPTKYKDAVKRFLDNISNQLTTEQRKKFGETLNVEWSNIDFNIAEEALKKAAEKASMQINNAAKKYDIWKEWFNATGDSKFAQQMSDSIIPVWDEKTKEMKKILENNISDSNIKLDFGAYVSDIDMKKRFDDAGLTQYYDQWREINKLVVDSGVQHQKSIAKSIESLQTYSEKLNVIEYNRTKDLEGVTDQYTIDRINAKYDKQIADLKPDRIAFFSAVTSMAKENVNTLAQTLKDELNKELEKGSISIEQYAKGIKEIDEQIKKSNNRNTSKTSAFIRGGRNGMVDYVKEQYNNSINEYARLNNRKTNLESILAKNPDNLSAAEELKSINSELKGVEKKVNKNKKDKDDIEAQEAEIAALNNFSSKLSQLSQVFSSLVDSFTAIFGENSTLTAAASVTSDAVNMASSLSNTAGQFGSSAGAAGLVAGLAIGGVTSVLNYNKQQQKKDEEAVKEIISILGNQYEKLSQIQSNGLGGAYQSLDSLYGTSTGDYIKKWLGNLEALDNFYNKFTDGTYAKKMAEQYSNYGVNEKYVGKSGEMAKAALADNSIYEAQLAMLYGQYDRMVGLISEESNKKDSDESVLNDYNEQLIELEGQIETFAQDMASALYSIDFKDWASQLGQSISDAWASGKNAAQAYFDTVSSLVKQSVTSAITQKYLEGIIQPLADQFIEQFSADKGQLTTESISILAKLNNVAGEAVDAYTQALNVVEEVMNENNNTLKNTASSNLGNSISSITEETADLLGSYVNAMRQDLSIQRIAVENIQLLLEDPNVGLERFNALSEAQLTQLRYIADNTQECANALRSLDDTLWNVVNGNKQIHVA